MIFRKNKALCDPLWKKIRQENIALRDITELAKFTKFSFINRVAK
jgi:hypothetical protein